MFVRTHKFLMDVVPGDVLRSDEDLHNGDPRVVKVVRTQDLTGVEYAVYFADGSITCTNDGSELVALHPRSPVAACEDKGF